MLGEHEKSLALQMLAILTPDNVYGNFSKSAGLGSVLIFSGPFPAK